MTTIDSYDDECRHGMFPASSCSICNGNDARRAAADTTVVHWFEARYDGPIACGCHVQIGDRIGRRADNTFVCSDHGR